MLKRERIGILHPMCTLREQTPRKQNPDARP